MDSKRNIKQFVNSVVVCIQASISLLRETLAFKYLLMNVTFQHGQVHEL